MFRQYVPKIGLSLERNTQNTPEPKRYYLIYKGKILSSYANEKEAMKAYKEKLQQLGHTLDPGKGKINVLEESLDRFFSAHDKYWSHSYKFRKGGKGR
ncbi:MAG: hypothetical protein WA148_00635 [Actinomycetota bacterium]